MHEDELIAHARERCAMHPAARQLRDDACVWTPGGQTCLSTDAVVEGVHFTADTDRESVGRKAVAAAVSDLAAMGAIPQGAVLALCAPAVDRQILLESCAAECERLNCPLVGGDTTDSATTVLTVTVWGEVGPEARFIGRDGGQPGDLLIVTGWLGGSFISGRHLRPEPRLGPGQWLATIDATHAMMDISDGLVADAEKLATASGCGAVLLPDQVPVHADLASHTDGMRRACCDGEDYELLIAIEPSRWPQLATAWPFDKLPLSVVGWLVAESGLWREDHRRRLVPLDWAGYRH